MPICKCTMLISQLIKHIFGPRYKISGVHPIETSTRIHLNTVYEMKNSTANVGKNFWPSDDVVNMIDFSFSSTCSPIRTRGFFPFFFSLSSSSFSTFSLFLPSFSYIHKTYIRLIYLNKLAIYLSECR